MNTSFRHGVVSARLPKDKIDENFCDLHPPLSQHEAVVAAERCYFCYDAPCMKACPTTIDIPLFIRQIATGNSKAAAKTIFDQNILGGMCARVCPTETLCQEACVREDAEGSPVLIGQLQRFATDSLISAHIHPYHREEETGKNVAIIGAGPAGLACAHRLALFGHKVVIYEAKEKGGGLNEFGIAAYKSTDNFAQDELAWLLSIGGITLKTQQKLGQNLSLQTLQENYDAIFLAIGLSTVNPLSLAGNHPHSIDAVDWIAHLRQAKDKSEIAVGRDVVVIGGGMTAVDAAVQAKLLGANNVTIAYRREKEFMSASQFEQDLATSKGVHILYNVTAQSVDADSICFKQNQSQEIIKLPADQIMRAIGQKMENIFDDLEIEQGKIKINIEGKTSIPKIWAGGDCATGGEDLTVNAVAQGRDSAMNINDFLMRKI